MAVAARHMRRALSGHLLVLVLLLLLLLLLSANVAPATAAEAPECVVDGEACAAPAVPANRSESRSGGAESEDVPEIPSDDWLEVGEVEDGEDTLAEAEAEAKAKVEAKAEAEAETKAGPIVLGEAPEQPEQVEDTLTWEEISGNVTIKYPQDGEEVVGSAVAVQVGLTTNCVNVTRFEQKFNHSDICISLDDAPFSCWPIFKISKFPLFTSVAAGEHKLVAKLVDPVNFETLLDNGAGSSTFTVTPRNDTADATDEDDEEDVEDEEHRSEEDEEHEQKTETIAIPQVGMEIPGEEMIMSPTFEVRLHVVTSANLTQFRRLFENSFICLSVDGTEFQSCWPLFEEAYYPKLFNLPLGKHVLEAHLSHPNTVELIPGTSVGQRTFWVSDKEVNAIPLRLREASIGSNAFKGDLREQATAEASRRQDAQREAQQQREAARQATLERAKVEPGVPQFASQNAQAAKQQQELQQRRLQQQQHQHQQLHQQQLNGNQHGEQQRGFDTRPQAHFTSTHGTGNGGAKRPHVTLQINVDNYRHTLTVFENEDYVSAAASFCVSRKIVGQNCVSSITRLIEIEWQKLYNIPHLELYSRED